MTGVIYIEPLEPLEEETRIFGEEKKNIKLEEELKVALNFFRITMTSIVAKKLWIIIISDSEEEVEIISQLIVEE